jgi:DNA-binding transcriptional LysR family regulator
MPTGITLRQLEVFSAVVAAGSVGAARRRIQLSQPTISHHIAKLEDALGTQLIVRSRSPEIELTPAGEYWYRCSTQLLGSFSEMVQHYSGSYSPNRLVIRFGATPSLRGRFLEAVARIAVAEPEISRLESVWGVSSAELVELFSLHQLNCAVLDEDSLKYAHESLSVTPLFTDRIVWVVPREVPANLVMETLMSRSKPSKRHEALSRYVDVAHGTPQAVSTEEWYRANLPFALPYFTTPTHLSAIDIVAAGVATCHCPLSQLPSLPRSMLEKINLFELDQFSQNIVLVMPKHLLTIPAFQRFRAAIVEFATEKYSKEMEPQAAFDLVRAMG